MSISIPDFDLHVSTFDYILQIHGGNDILASQVVRIGPIADFDTIPAVEMLRGIDAAIHGLGARTLVRFPAGSTVVVRRRPVMDAMIPADYIDVAPPVTPVQN